MVFYRVFAVGNQDFAVDPPDDAIIALQKFRIYVMFKVLFYPQSLMFYPINPISIKQFCPSEIGLSFLDSL